MLADPIFFFFSFLWDQPCGQVNLRELMEEWFWRYHRSRPTKEKREGWPVIRESFSEFNPQSRIFQHSIFGAGMWKWLDMGWLVKDSSSSSFQPHGINSIIISGKCGWKRKRKSCTTAGKTWTTFCRWFVQDLQPVDPGFFSCAFLSDSKSLDWRELTISSLFSCARANQWSWNSRSGSP